LTPLHTTVTGVRGSSSRSAETSRAAFAALVHAAEPAGRHDLNAGARSDERGRRDGRRAEPGTRHDPRQIARRALGDLGRPEQMLEFRRRETDLDAPTH
jgi:hypothetical protein